MPHRTRELSVKIRLAAGATAVLAAVALTGCGSDVASDAASAAASAAASVAASAASGVASSAAAAASSAVGQATDAVCQTLGQVQTSVTEQTDPKATVGDVRAAAEQSQQQLDQLKSEAGVVQQALITGLQAAESSLLSNLEGQPDDTPISEASPAIQQAIQGVSTAYTSLNSALGCEGASGSAEPSPQAS